MIMTWKVGCALVLALPLFSNIYWLYIILDAGVTYTHQQDSLKSSEKNLDLLKEIVPRICAIDDANQFLVGLKGLNNGIHHVIQKQDGISIDGVNFKI